MKPVRFIGSARDDLAGFPAAVRARAGHELFMVQLTRDPSGAYRVIDVAKLADAVYVLHPFQKKTQKTARTDLDLAMQRYRIARELAEGVNRA